MIKGILYKYLLKAILIALVALILYGVFSAASLAIIIILFVGLRFTSLVAESLRKPVSPERWERMVAALTGSYEKLTPEKRAAKAVALKLDSHRSARELAQAQVNQTIRGYVPPRPKRELGAEALGVIAFTILIPLDIALYTRDIFSLRIWQGWEGAIVVCVCVALYVWPHRWLKSPDLSDVRIWWWVVPFIIVLPLLNHVIETRHPYLNPFNPDRNRLAAERVLSLKNNITAGQYADWVLRYARQLDARGESQQAIHYYREGLRLDANDHAAYTRLAILEAQSSGSATENVDNTAVVSSTPYWIDDEPMPQSPRRRIDSQLENVEGCTVIIVPVGDVPDELLDAVGYVIHNELGLPVYISPDSVPVPPRTRVRGLATGPQWDEASLVQAFTNTTKLFPSAPIKYVMITPVDIYIDDVNYVFSTTYKWGALVSSARFGEPNGDDSLLRQRTAKQALCALLKSFNVPASPDRNDVTSYTRSLEEFDAKGNRPDAETLILFRQAVVDLNSRWQRHKAMQAVPR
jgi:predicted Zn-dependent protease